MSGLAGGSRTWCAAGGRHDLPAGGAKRLKQPRKSGVLLPMRMVFVLGVTALLLLASCNHRQPPPTNLSKPDVAEQAIGYARSIVSDPSNWKSNSVSYTKLGEAAQDLGIEKSPEFQNFEVAANKLISFGTRWVSNVDEGTASALKQDLSHLTTSTETSASLQVSGGSVVHQPVGEVKASTVGIANSEQTQAEAEHAIYTSITGLRAAQADEFGKDFQDSQSAFLALRALLLTRVKTPSNSSN